MKKYGQVYRIYERRESSSRHLQGRPRMRSEFSLLQLLLDCHRCRLCSLSTYPCGYVFPRKTALGSGPNASL